MCCVFREFVPKQREGEAGQRDGRRTKETPRQEETEKGRRRLAVPRTTPHGLLWPGRCEESLEPLRRGWQRGPRRSGARALAGPGKKGAPGDNRWQSLWPVQPLDPVTNSHT